VHACDAAEDQFPCALGGVRQHWKGIGVVLFVNWTVKPFSMVLLGWTFIRDASSTIK
jgi:ACR3 family arsenite efflux pump ArsB